MNVEYGRCLLTVLVSGWELAQGSTTEGKTADTNARVNFRTASPAGSSGAIFGISPRRGIQTLNPKNRSTCVRVLFTYFICLRKVLHIYNLYANILMLN